MTRRPRHRHSTPRRRAALRLALGLLASAGLLAFAHTAPAAAAVPATPIAVGDTAASITLDRPEKLVALRFVADRTGTLDVLDLRVRLDGTPCGGGSSNAYAGGSGGVVQATLERVLADGRPNPAAVVARDDFSPCARFNRGSLAVDLGVAVSEGDELALVVGNGDPKPAVNFFSLSFLYSRSGVVGANGRNERSAAAADADEGLDPRELVGWSTDGGASWLLPGGPFGPNGGAAFVPTYVLEYAGGGRSGQPFTSAADASGTFTMVYPNVPVPWTITALGASTSGTGASVVTLTVDGVERGTAFLSGSGILRASIDPVTVQPGSTVRVTTTAGRGGLALHRLSTDAIWASLARLGSGSRFFLEGDPTRAVPVYPLPLYAADTRPPSAPDGLSPTAVGQTSIALAFQPATDDRGVAGYDVLLDGALTTTLPGTATAVTVANLACGSRHTVSLAAFDAAGNRSEPESLDVSSAACPQRQLPAPLAGGDGAANVVLDSAEKLLLVRFVPRRSGAVEGMALQAKLDGTACVQSTRTGYAAGSGGVLRASVYPVRADGTPDTATLLARDDFSPCSRYTAGVIRLSLGFAVTARQEYALVIQNADPDPADNYFSLNFLYVKSGLQGANGRNERSAGAFDAYYGLDPRELVGYSSDGGSSWRLPGGPYGPNGGAAFLPTYELDYASGAVGGQPYYYSSEVGGTFTMVFPNVPVRWTIEQLGAVASTSGSATVTLAVDGVDRASATLSGSGILRAPITPVTVEPGSTVTLTTVVGSGGLGLRRLAADATWTRDFGLGSGFRYYLQGDPSKALPLYPLPMYPPDGQAPTAPSGLVVAGATDTTLTVRWNGAQDDRSVTAYELSLDGQPVASLDASAREYVATGLTCGTTHTVAIDAVDASGNRSSQAVLTGSTTPCPVSQADARPPVAFGDGSSSVAFDSAAKRLVLRFVAARSGVLAHIGLRARLDLTTCATGVAGYAAGTSGLLHATLERVLADGRPNPAAVLASDEFAPCARYSGGALTVDVGASVRAGDELALVVWNADPAPSANFFSLSFLYDRDGTIGANSRNERDASAYDAYYGLDPRELVGWSTDGGDSWLLPGGPYGANGGAVLVPTYTLDYADGGRGGQPYYYTTALSGTATMVFPNVPARWTIRYLGASTSGPGSAVVTLSVDGVQRASATLAGTGMLRAPISPVTVEPGSTVRVTTTAGTGGLALRVLHADGTWSALEGLGAGYRYFLEGDEQDAVPLYPLPLYDGFNG